MRYMVLLAGMLFMLLAPCAAQAARDGIVLEHTGLRAGPDKSYPLLLDLRRGDRVEVLGCVRGWKWCEVVAGGLHGFAVGKRIGADYYGQDVQVAYYGYKLELPYVMFQEQPYWTQYYANRDFYQRRYGPHRDYHNNLKCSDPDHDGDCHAVVRDHRHDQYDHNYDRSYNGAQHDSGMRWSNDWHNDNTWHVNN
jgi:uncharacterized protein YraI